MSDFITSDDELSYDYADFEYEEEPSEDVSEEASEEASESDIEELNIFPITAHRKKYIVRFAEFEYY